MHNKKKFQILMENILNTQPAVTLDRNIDRTLMIYIVFNVQKKFS